MESAWTRGAWSQFGAAIDMLEKAIVACPEPLWSDRSRKPEVWYLVYHTLFWLDLYLSKRVEGFRPPQPYTLDELDPAGVMPERVYEKSEMRAYLEHGRRKCRATIAALSEESAGEEWIFGGIRAPAAEMLLYNLRHLQHHTAQLYAILRQEIDSTPGWVSKVGEKT